jgi:hypothetical protein
VVVCSYDSSTWKLKQEDYKFEASLGYIARLSSKKKEKGRKKTTSSLKQSP